MRPFRNLSYRYFPYYNNTISPSPKTKSTYNLFLNISNSNFLPKWFHLTCNCYCCMTNLWQWDHTHCQGRILKFELSRLLVGLTLWTSYLVISLNFKLDFKSFIQKLKIDFKILPFNFKFLSLKLKFLYGYFIVEILKYKSKRVRSKLL